MMKKRYKIMLLAFIIMNTSINKCYAEFGHNVKEYTIHTGGNEGSNEQPHDNIKGWKPSGASSEYDYKCEYYYNIYSSSSLVVDMLNKNNKSIVSKINGEIVFSEDVPAGTSTKINITETKSRWYVLGKITATYKRRGTYQVCSRYKYEEFREYGLVGGWVTVNTCNISSSNCKRTCTKYKDQEYSTHTYGSDTSQYNNCKNQAEAELKNRIDTSMYSSYTIRIQNPNYINAGLPNTNVSGEDRVVYEISTATSNCEQKENGKTCIFTYTPKTICMNVKTAQLFYKNSDECGDDEIKIKNTQVYGKTYWNYFVPLDTKEDSSFSFSMVRSSQNDVQSVDFCTKLMQQEPGYVNFIKTVKNLPLSGNFNKDLITIKGNNGVDAGCILSTELHIPTVQEFYREIEKQDSINKGESKYKLKGFNFYFKPIDINNPFPNGLASNSLWINWEKNQNTNKENPDLSESFKQKTYATNNIKAELIRDYNKGNKYADWTNMYTSGVSKFIETQNMVERLVDTKSFYKLGCGPANKDWEGCKQ